MEKKFTSTYDVSKAQPIIDKDFDEIALPALMDYVRIPNLSRLYDEQWEKNGNIMKAAEHIKKWIEDQKVKDLKIEIISEPGRSPLIYAEIPRTDEGNKTILIYAHFDKQPHGEGWHEGLGPITPVIKEGKLYGRGASDDGYAPFSMITAIKAIEKLGYKHPRIVLTFESEEESGSVNYMYYMNKLDSRIGKPDVLICTDSGCCTYDALWLSNSLRGNLKVDLKVQVLEQNVHSGEASGVVPSSFRILRRLLDRIEDPDTGKIIDDLQVNIPPERYEELYQTAQELGESKVLNIFPYMKNMVPVTQNVLEAYINKTWRSQLAVVGMDGIPSLQQAGNVLRSYTTFRLSLRLPPTLLAEEAGVIVKKILEKDPPYGSKVTCTVVSANNGWNAPKLENQLQQSLE